MTKNGLAAVPCRGESEALDRSIAGAPPPGARSPRPSPLRMTAKSSSANRATRSSSRTVARRIPASLRSTVAAASRPRVSATLRRWSTSATTSASGRPFARGFAHLDAEPLEEALARRQPGQRIVPGGRSDAPPSLRAITRTHRDAWSDPRARGTGSAMPRRRVTLPSRAKRARFPRTSCPRDGNERAVEKDRRARGAPDDVGGRPAGQLLHPAVETDDRPLAVHEKRSSVPAPAQASRLSRTPLVSRVVPHRPSVIGNPDL